MVSAPPVVENGAFESRHDRVEGKSREKNPLKQRWTVSRQIDIKRSEEQKGPDDRERLLGQFGRLAIERRGRTRGVVLFCVVCERG